MTRFLILLLAGVLASWLIRRSFLQLASRVARHPLGALLQAILGAKPPGAAPMNQGGASRPEAGAPLVRCSKCGTHVPRERAEADADGQAVCSDCG